MRSLSTDINYCMNKINIFLNIIIPHFILKHDIIRIIYSKIKNRYALESMWLRLLKFLKLPLKI